MNPMNLIALPVCPKRCTQSFACGLMSALLLTSSHAATISWTGSNIADPSDVSTNGTFIGAMNMDSPSSRTINGVTFAPDPGSNGVAMALGSATVEVSWGVGSANNGLWAGAAPGGDANYDDALDYARNAGPYSIPIGTITLGGLVVGTYYDVQMWIVDTRGCCSNRVRTVDGTLAMNSGAGPHIARGVFRADAATQVINITPDVPADGPQLNLLQLRSIVPNVVLNANDSGPGSLRQTVADAVDGETITFTNTLSGATILLTSGEILVTNKNLSIDASALPAGITLSANTNSRHFEVSSDTFSLSHMTFVQGRSSAGNGGAIYVAGFSTELEVHSCSFVGNTTPYVGGAIATQNGNTTIDNTTFTSNSAAVDGGAIFISTGGTLTLSHATLSGNSATEDGGGILNYFGTVSLNNTTLSGNSAGFEGGGIFNANGTLTLNNATLSGNSATNQGGGIGHSGGTVNLTNTIVSGNTASFWPNVHGNPSGESNLVDVGNINLAPLGNYGGPTQTMPPLPGSPAIDAGEDAAASGFAYDQRGPGFPRVSGDHVDIGAVELQLITGSTPVEITNLMSLGDGTFQFNFTNDIGASFRVLATTNVALPASNWLFLGFATETPPSSGQFQFTDPGATNFPQRYYRVKSP